MMEQQKKKKKKKLNEGDQYWERRTVRYRDCENSDSNSKSLFDKDCSSERFFELRNTSFGPRSHASRSLACLVQTHTQNEGCSENIPVDVSEGNAQEPPAECRNKSSQQQVLAAHRNQTSQSTFCPTDRIRD